MTSTMPISTLKLLRTFILSGAALLLIAGCATTPAARTPHSKAAAHQQSKPVDAKAQQQYYDLGLQYYSRESYGEAKKAFRVVVELGPNTQLGIKAQENLKKIQQILRTLEEIESK